MPDKGTLFLIPVPIAENTHDDVVTPQVRRRLTDIRHFLAEDIRTARRFLSSLKIYGRIEDLSFSVLDKNTGEKAIAGLFEPAFRGHDIGVLSESGCPGIADPGALAVRFAHRHDIRVMPLTGPSSILLALMASGLNGQRFAFYGYLPVQAAEAGKVIRELEKNSRAANQTEIVIETPYRNNALLAHLLKSLQPGTNLCIALDVTGEHEFIATRTVAEWRAAPVTLSKHPAVFLFLA